MYLPFMKTLPFLQNLPKRLRRLRRWRQPVPPPKPTNVENVYDEIHAVPVWLGTQLTPFPIVMKRGKRRVTLYDDWD